MTARLRNAAVLNHLLTRVDEERYETVTGGKDGIVAGIDSMRHGCRVQRRRKLFLTSGWNDLVIGGDDHGCRYGNVGQPGSRIERANLASRFEHVTPIVAGNLASGPIGQLVRLALQVDLFGDPRPSLSARQFGQPSQSRQSEEVEALVA